MLTSSQVIFPAGNIAYIDGRELELLQFHFHTPSEHAINGRRFPMEAHLVHKDKATGRKQVLMAEGCGGLEWCAGPEV